MPEALPDIQIFQSLKIPPFYGLIAAGGRVTIATFDARGYFEKLKAGPEEQATVQANAFRDFSVIQDENVRNVLRMTWRIYECDS